MKKINTSKAVILDRDGVINVDKGHTWRVEDLELIEGSAEAIKLLNDAGYYVFVVTNQSVIGRGICTYDDVNRFNQKLNETICELSGGQINKFFVCPHSTDKNGRPTCRCRKPSTYWYRKIINRFSIKECYVIGDKETDLIPGEELGLMTFQVMTGEGERNDKYTNCTDLMSAVQLIKALKGGEL